IQEDKKEENNLKMEEQKIEEEEINPEKEKYEEEALKIKEEINKRKKLKTEENNNLNNEGNNVMTDMYQAFKTIDENIEYLQTEESKNPKENGEDEENIKITENDQNIKIEDPNQKEEESKEEI
ncbi:MAG: hypothetical protein MJ252_12820, partial [archaeon]|nr:hypothetical protein [archaeon]